MELPSYITSVRLNHFISEALQEDVGEGDHTTLAAVPEGEVGRAKLIVKEDTHIAGIEMAKMIFAYYDQSLKVATFLQDGDRVSKGEIAFTVEGKARSILTTERLVLNCMQRMSGIANNTHEIQKIIGMTQAKLLDTRKTTPNFRMCEKWAVVIGGGHNHRYGLYDMIMLKDNHIDYCGGIKQAVARTRAYLDREQKILKIEVETRNLEEVRQALEASVDRIMLDNFSIENLKEAVKLIDHIAETEASGGITAENILEVAQTGVDFISVGALIHSASNVDLSLKAF